MWYLESGYSRHMIGDKSKVNSLELKRGGNVTLRDNKMCEVLRSGIINMKKSLLKKFYLCIT